MCLATASIHFIMDVVVNGSIYKSAHRMTDAMGIQLVNILLGTSPLWHGLRHYVQTDKHRQKVCSLSWVVIEYCSKHPALTEQMTFSPYSYYDFPQINMCYHLFQVFMSFLNYAYLLAPNILLKLKHHVSS